MPLDPNPIRADVTASGLTLDEHRLARKLDRLPPGMPVVAMIHGWRYAPGLRDDCPHHSILSLDPAPHDRRAISWPRHLHLDGTRGLAIALGWPARCDPWRAHARAIVAGTALAEVARRVHRLSGRRLHVIAHSLGARVALHALSLAEPRHFGRLILLAAAETRATALAAMISPAGRCAEVINVASRENDLFDACFEWGLHFGVRTSVGQGLGHPHPGWHDLWIDRPSVRTTLAALGHPLGARQGRVCHWSPYLRPGIFSLYRALIDGSLSCHALPATRPARRWSRLLAGGETWPVPTALPLQIP